MNKSLSSWTTERIWRRLSDRLRQFIRSRITAGADVDDILQTVFLTIHQKIQTLRQEERIESWVFQITRNAIIDHFRKNHQLRTAEDFSVETPESETGENANREIAGCLTLLMDGLPEDQKRAVSMYELQGLSQAEIARRESISLSGAKSRIQRGRQRLEALLRACCELQTDSRGNVLDYRPMQPEGPSNRESSEVDLSCSCLDGLPNGPVGEPSTPVKSGCRPD